MIRSITGIALVCIASAVALGGEIPEGMSGTWMNVDKGTGGVTKLVITNGEKGPTIEAWGKCVPKDCEWGATPLALLGQSVQAKELPYGFASWDHKFVTRHMILRRDEGDVVVETYNIFKDMSGRSNYHAEFRFERSKD